MTTNHSLSQTSIRTLNAFSHVTPEYTKGIVAADLEHASFIAKSDYDLPQLSTKITFMKFRDILIPIANESQALVEVVFKQVENGFQTLRITDKTYSQMESVA